MTRLYAVYQIEDTTASVPGGQIISLHRTVAGAERAKATAEAAEAERQSRPKMIRSRAIRFVREQYGYYFPHMYDAVRSLMHRSKRVYRVLEVEDEIEVAHGVIRRSEAGHMSILD